MKRVCKHTILLGLFCFVPALSFAAPQQSEADGVREAIRFQKAKDAADARQARLEEKHPTVTAAPGTADTGRAVSGKRVADPGVQEAIRFERNKDAASARQARMESQRATTGAADRQAASKK